MREKGGTAKVRNGYGRTNSTCPHVWSDLNGEVELKELHDLEKDTKAFLAAKSLWEWEHDYWLSKIK
jgi:hypothetical protein